MTSNDLYIGLMSGTSVDGIDAVLTHFTDHGPNLIQSLYVPYDAAIREQILALCVPGENEIERAASLDVTLGKAFADVVRELLNQSGHSAKAIKAIGSHGQTIRHAPNSAVRFTLQIGDPNTIAALTGITTIADFRRKDMALAGQGAPLVPAFHHYLLHNQPRVERAIVNIGGIANVTLLLKNRDVIGFDTGPGNTLMDAWIHKHLHKNFDEEGRFAREGRVNPTLFQKLLADDYFQKAFPKSTGREYFNLTWLQASLSTLNNSIAPADVQATLLELTAQSIMQAIRSEMLTGEILICGGGAHNKTLLQRLTQLAAPQLSVNTISKYGVHPDWVEATAFAWLAQRTLHQLPGNLPSVTGAKQSTILGAIYYA